MHANAPAHHTRTHTHTRARARARINTYESAASTYA